MSNQLHKLIRRLRQRTPQPSVTSSDDVTTHPHDQFIAYRSLTDIGDPILSAIRRKDMKKLLKLLNRPGVAPTRVEQHSRVLMACEEGNLDALRLLVERGAPLNRGADADAASVEATPLIVTATLGYAEIVRYLLDHGADVNQACTQPVLEVVEAEACETESRSERAELLDAYVMNTPLIQACREGHVVVVGDLLAHGCDVNVQNANGNTALHVACLGRTFYPYSTNRSQYVPSAFFLRPDARIIEQLLRRGARTDIRNHNGHTALQRVFEIRTCPSLQITGWRFTSNEFNAYFQNLFKELRVLIEHGCHLPAPARNRKFAGRDLELTREMFEIMRFAAHFYLSPDTVSEMSRALVASVENGCRYELSALMELDAQHQRHVVAVIPMLCTVQPLRSICRIFLRTYLGMLHEGQLSEVVFVLPIPPPLIRYILDMDASSQLPTLSRNSSPNNV